jgi:hypothetical protein
VYRITYAIKTTIFDSTDFSLTNELLSLSPDFAINPLHACPHVRAMLSLSCDFAINPLHECPHVRVMLSLSCDFAITPLFTVIHFICNLQNRRMSVRVQPQSGFKPSRQAYHRYQGYHITDIDTLE